MLKILLKNIVSIVQLARLDSSFLLSGFYSCENSIFDSWLAWFIANIIGGIWAFLVFYAKTDIFHSRFKREGEGESVR